jgi:uncharacterized membrane protein
MPNLTLIETDYCFRVKLELTIKWLIWQNLLIISSIAETNHEHCLEDTHGISLMYVIVLLTILCGFFKKE